MHLCVSSAAAVLLGVVRYCPSADMLLLLLLWLTGEKACLWAFNFFFYNKKMKRILYIGVKAVSKLAADDEKVGAYI